MAVKLSVQKTEITETLQLVMLLKTGYKERLSQRQAEWEQTGPILRGHTVFGPCLLILGVCRG